MHIEKKYKTNYKKCFILYYIKLDMIYEQIGGILGYNKYGRTWREHVFMKKKLNLKSLHSYQTYLKNDEKALATVSKYCHDIEYFFRWNGGGRVSKPRILEYKAYLKEHFRLSSANSMLVSLNGYLKYCGYSQWCVKLFKIQRSTFVQQDKELTKEEYFRLLHAAGKGSRIEMVIETIAATGIRVSELPYITIEAVDRGQASICNKGKERKILLASKLRVKLKQYARRRGIKRGSLFVTRSGKPLDRSNVWAAMKALCKKAGVEPEKVFPHNLRHLFARTFYEIKKDIARLSDLLGHSQIETTRLYIKSSDREHIRQIEKMDLLL